MSDKPHTLRKRIETYSIGIAGERHATTCEKHALTVEGHEFLRALGLPSDISGPVWIRVYDANRCFEPEKSMECYLPSPRGFVQFSWSRVAHH